MYFARFLYRLIRTSTNISTNIRTQFLLHLICYLLNFRRFLAGPRGFQVINLDNRRDLVGQCNRHPQASQGQRPSVHILLRVRGEYRQGRNTLRNANNVLRDVTNIRRIRFRHRRINATSNNCFRTLRTSTMRNVNKSNVILNRIVFHLYRNGHGRVNDNLLKCSLYVMGVLLLRLFMLRQLGPTFPAREVMASRALQMTRAGQGANRLNVLISARTPRVTRLHVRVRHATHRIRVLSSNGVTMYVRKLLTTVSIGILFKIMALNSVTIMLYQDRIRHRTKGTIYLVNTMFPVANRVRILNTRNFRQAIVHRNGNLLRVRHCPLLNGDKGNSRARRGCGAWFLRTLSFLWVGRCVGKVVGELADIPAGVTPVVTVRDNFYDSRPVSGRGDDKAVTGVIIDSIVVVNQDLLHPTS